MAQREEELSFIKSIADLERELGEIDFPWNDICPLEIIQWLECFSKCHRTSKELMLMTMLFTTSALLGHSVVKIYDNDPFDEKANLHFIITGPSGIGKSPAARHGCQMPLTGHLEPKVNKVIWTDEPTESGLFNFFVNNDVVPILCVDEATEFLRRTILNKGRKGLLEMSRLCKLYDGDSWFVIKGSQGKRKGVVKEARCAFLALCTANEFLKDIWPKAVSAKNGFPDRILFMYQSEQEKATLTEVGENLGKLREEFGALQSPNGVFEDIFVRHNGEHKITYTLATEAREVFAKHVDEVIPSQSTEARFQSQCSHKTDRNILKIALNQHVLYDRISKVLNGQAGPVPNLVRSETMGYAIALVEFLKRQRAISEICVNIKENTSVSVGMMEMEVKRRLLVVPGPFCSRKRLYNSISSTDRPSSQKVELAMESLKEELLGVIVKVRRGVFFYKVFPHMVDVTSLAKYGISREEYKDTYFSEDPLITPAQKLYMENHHPKKDEYDFLDATVPLA